MKEDKNIARLVCDLEYLIGTECYNPNSYDGWTGISGCSFRYPVWYRRNNEATSLSKTSRSIADSCPDLPYEMIETIKYKFGSNQLFVGMGIIRILKALEKRYGIDFSEMEEMLITNSD